VPCSSQTRRRWFGTLCLLIAIGMLTADEFLFKGRLRGLAFLAYWLVCLVLTLLAIVAATLDVRALRRSTREQQRALFENTLQNIPKEKQQTGKSADSE